MPTDKRVKKATKQPKTVSKKPQSKKSEGLQKTPHGRWNAQAKKKAKEIILEMTKDHPALNVVLGAAQVPCATFYNWKGEDKEFREAYEALQQANIRRFEREAWRRATEGNSEAVFDKDGAVIGEKIKQSDTLLIACLKRYSPEWQQALSMNKTIITGGTNADHAIKLKLTGPLDDDDE